MPIFSSPDPFKEHPKYIPLLKKALLTIKADSQKKFLYFKQYPFGAKKLPLVLVDFDSGCVAALAKAGQKPTAEGLVSLTTDDELNFDAKKGTLKRIRLKKYFATMGGIKSVYVPPGETDDEDQADAMAEAALPHTSATEKAAGADDNERNRSQLLARIQELQAKSFPPKIEGLKKQVLEKARSLAEANKFPEGTMLLDQLAAKAGPGPGSTAGGGDFRQRWVAAKQTWQTSSDNLDTQITELQQALRKSGDGELMEIAEFGLNGVTGNFKVPLMTAIREVDAASGDGLQKASTKARGIIAGFRKHLESDERVQACADNPFGVNVSIRETIGEGLDKLDEALAAATA
jgi:hypothetical protein